MNNITNDTCSEAVLNQSVNKTKQHEKWKFTGQNEKHSRNNRANSITLNTHFATIADN